MMDKPEKAKEENINDFGAAPSALPLQMIQNHLGLSSHQLQALLQQQHSLLAFHQVRF